MIRSELLQALAKDYPDLRSEDVELALDTFFGQIADRLASGGRVELRGFGAFSTRRREPRKGRRELAQPGFQAKVGLPVHSEIPRDFRALARVWVAREQCVLTLPSEQPMTCAVSATSNSSK